MMGVDKAYQILLDKVLEEGKEKQDRTGTGTISIFSHTLEIDMADGFPLLTTKKMFTKGIIHELLWFLKGDTNIKYLVDNGINIWTPDAYREYKNNQLEKDTLSIEEFKKVIVDNKYFAKRWGELGPVYGKQWVNWGGYKKTNSKGYLHNEDGVWYVKWSDLQSFAHGKHWHYTKLIDSDQSKYGSGNYEHKEVTFDQSFFPDNIATIIDDSVVEYKNSINQIQNAIDLLNNNPDSRRIIVSAWSPGELDKMALPPCHWAFELYTEELTASERWDWYNKNGNGDGTVKLIALVVNENEEDNEHIHKWLSKWASKVPTRRLSLKWHQRSVDFFLGLPFNIASYGLLLEMFAQQTNMVPGKLVGDLTNVHIYNNHIEQCKTQLDRVAMPLPRLELTKADDMFSYCYEDVKILNYSSHPAIKGDISV